MARRILVPKLYGGALVKDRPRKFKRKQKTKVWAFKRRDAEERRRRYPGGSRDQER